MDYLQLRERVLKENVPGFTRYLQILDGYIEKYQYDPSGEYPTPSNVIERYHDKRSPIQHELDQEWRFLRDEFLNENPNMGAVDAVNYANKHLKDKLAMLTSEEWEHRRTLESELKNLEQEKRKELTLAETHIKAQMFLGRLTKFVESTNQ